MIAHQEKPKRRGFVASEDDATEEKSEKRKVLYVSGLLKYMTGSREEWSS